VVRRLPLPTRDLGCNFAGFPYLAPERRGGEDFYHNHDFKFTTYSGRYALDVLLESADAELVGSELDVYWVKHTGLDPAAYIRALGRRCLLLHLKDMARDADRSFTEIGEGVLDMDGIVAAGQELGVQYLALTSTPMSISGLGCAPR
jgi:sugar phosphate isomerase/epimerase